MKMKKKARVNILRIKPANKRKTPFRIYPKGKYTHKCTYSGRAKGISWEEKGKLGHVRDEVCRIVKGREKANNDGEKIHLVELTDGSRMWCHPCWLEKL